MPTTVVDIIQEWLFREDRQQVQLARRAKIAPATLSRILAGKQVGGHKALRRLELAMGLPPGHLEAVQAQQKLQMNNGAGG